jgi:uncharacterized protein (DUF58 family)
MPATERSFPLIPQRRVVGLFFGAMRSARRGVGSDVASSRPYQPGDDVDTIDWYASARLSAARASDEFIVREHYAEQAPRVVVVCDRRPSMSYFAPETPWLCKPEALREVTKLISDSALAARGFMGYLDYAEGEPYWHPPRSQLRLELAERDAYRAPDDTLARALRHLARHRRAAPAGTFLFVVSDFLVAPSRKTWLHAIAERWDIVPVILQDPRWERSFPDVGGISVGLSDPATGRTRYVRLSRREAAARREANETRWRDLLAGFRRLALDPVVVASSNRADVLGSFLAWAEHRRYARAWGW